MNTVIRINLKIDADHENTGAGRVYWKLNLLIKNYTYEQHIKSSDYFG